MDPDDDPSVHRLEGSSGNQPGGLVIMKKGPSKDSEKHDFKKPSLLGLDRLAAVKRQQEDDKQRAHKKSKVTSYKDDNVDDESSSDSDSDNDENYKKTSKKDRKKERLVNSVL